MTRTLAAVGGWTARTARAAPRWTAQAIGSGWHLGAQLGGATAALTGLHMWAGTAATLIIGGLGVATIGTLAEMHGPAKGD
jgi:hypothetical protein